MLWNRYGVAGRVNCLVSFQIVDRIRRQSSSWLVAGSRQWAS